MQLILEKLASLDVNPLISMDDLKSGIFFPKSFFQKVS
jgi:hypothetical protein